MSETVKIGIVGIGNMGSAHAKSILAGNIQGMELAAVCDIAESKRLWAAENLPDVPCFIDYKEMIDSNLCTAILVATPHYLHSRSRSTALKKGHARALRKAGRRPTKQVRR